MLFIVYASDGMIRRTGVCPAEVFESQAQFNAGDGVLEDMADGTVEKVDITTKTVVAKTVIPASHTGTTITNLPPGSTVTVNKDHKFPLPDGDTSIAFVFTTGLYDCLCQHPLYLPLMIPIIVP